MADTLVERLTGQTSAAAVPVHIQLVMTDATLLAGDPEPAELAGHGPLPAPLVRSWLRGDDHTGLPANAEAWLRRLYTTPDSAQLIAMDSRARCFDGQLRQFLITADRTCPHPLVRRPHPPHRPPHPCLRRRADHRRQQPGAVRGVQLRQGGARLADRPPARPSRRDDHPDRAPVPQPTPTTRRPYTPRTSLSTRNPDSS